jgi:hypothetical protein
LPWAPLFVHLGDLHSDALFIWYMTRVRGVD